MPALLGAGNIAVGVGVRLCAIAVVALVAALVLGWPSLVPASLILIGAAYATHLAVDDAPLDAKAPLFAAGLVVVAELAYWALEERDDVRSDRGESLRRLGFVALLALGALAVGGLLLYVTDGVESRSLALDVLGAAAAAAVLLVVVIAARGSARN